MAIWQRLQSIVLFRACDAQTPLATLRARRWWVDVIVTTWLASTAIMIESFASLMFFRGSTLEIILLLTSAAIALPTAIPAIVLMPIGEELERELRVRGAVPANHTTIESRVEHYVLKAVLFFFLGVATIAIMH